MSSLEIRGPFLLYKDGDKVIGSWSCRFVQHWITYTGRPTLPYAYQGPVIQLSPDAIKFINDAEEHNPTISYDGEVHMIDLTVPGPIKLRRLAPEEIPKPQIFQL